MPKRLFYGNYVNQGGCDMKYLEFDTPQKLSDFFGLTCEITYAGHPVISIEESVILDVTEKLVFKGDVLIRDNVRIAGRDIELGHKFYADHHAEIGGGSCYGIKSRLKIGEHFHMGCYSLINTARKVIIGDVVGMGRFSSIHTHGAYLNVLDGFPEQWGPVQIGNNVWLPNATVLPNVTIGDNTVVANNSLVNKDIEGGGLWAGIPAKKMERVKYPEPMNSHDRITYLEDLKVIDKEELRRHGIREMIE